MWRARPINYAVIHYQQGDHNVIARHQASSPALLRAGLGMHKWQRTFAS
jgi:hypothetical protein